MTSSRDTYRSTATAVIVSLPMLTSFDAFVLTRYLRMIRTTRYHYSNGNLTAGAEFWVYISNFKTSSTPFRLVLSSSI